MAEPPQSGAPPEPKEPTRPDAVRQPVAFPQSQSMDVVQPAANKYNEAAQAVQQKQWEAKQEKPQDEQQVRKEANQELAAKLAASSFSRTPELDRER